MSIFSKIKRGVKKVVKTVGGAVSSALSLANKAVTGNLGKSQAASVANSLAGKQASNPAAQTYNPNITLKSGGIGQSQPDNSILTLDKKGRPTGAISSSGVGMSIQPKTIGPMSVGSSSRNPSPIYSASSSYKPTTISGSSSNRSSSASVGAITASGIAPSASIALPSAPSYSNPGVVNNGGLVSALSDTHAYDPQTNSFVQKPQEPQAGESALGQTVQEKIKALYGDIPEKESLYKDKDIRKQRAEVQRQQQIVADYTAQLNSVTAQQNADLLKLRGVGSQEGVTETVYGGQAATINREAAIKALPIQASLSAAQGNLELAQDYLTQLSTWKAEEIDNRYQYKVALYNSIKDYVKGEEKTKLDKLEKEETRAYQEKRDNVNTQDAWAKIAVQNGQSYLINGIMALNPASPTFMQEIARYQSQVVDASNARANANASGGSGGVAITAEDKRTLIGGGFEQADIEGIRADVAKYGVQAVIDGLSDPKQKAAVAKVYGTTVKKSREDIASVVTAKVAQDTLEKTYTDDEMKKLAEEDGYRHWWAPWSSEKESWLTSEKAKQRVVDLYLAQQ